MKRNFSYKAFFLFAVLLLATACEKTAGSYDSAVSSTAIQKDMIGEEERTEETLSYSTEAPVIFIETTVSENAGLESKEIEKVSDFSLEGVWKSIGSYGFGQAQPGSLVSFDGINCNMYSPKDTYVFYRKKGKLVLECTSFLTQDPVSFKVEILDEDTIHLHSGEHVTELYRIQ